MFDWSKDNGGNLNQWEFWGGDGQKFVIEPVNSGSDLGDVNADGEVNIADIVELQNYLLGKTNYLIDWKLADMNKDGKLNGYDDILLRRLIFNK